MNDRLSYMGFFISGSQVQQVRGYPVGVDINSGKHILAVPHENSATVFVPHSVFKVTEIGCPNRIDDAKSNSAVNMGVLLVEEIRGLTGCIDKFGNEIYHQSFIDVDGRAFFVFYSNTRMRWELLEVGEGFDPSCPDETVDYKPVALYRLKQKIAEKAVLLPWTDHILRAK